MKRTPKQNNSLWLYAELLAQEMADAGIDMREAIRVPIKPNQANVMDNMIRPVMEAMYPGVKSTKDLETHEVVELYDTMNRFVAERMEIHVPWPSIESLSESQR